MIIKRGGHIFGKTQEVRKGLWALFSLLYVLDADWLDRQTSITWSWVWIPFCLRGFLCICFSCFIAAKITVTCILHQ